MHVIATGLVRSAEDGGRLAAGATEVRDECT